MALNSLGLLQRAQIVDGFVINYVIMLVISWLSMFI